MRKIIKGKLFSRTNHRRAPQVESLDPRMLLSTTFTVNNLIDETTPNDSLLSLREAITQANSTPGADTIVFSPSLNGVINLANGQLEITSDMTRNTASARIARCPLESILVSPISHSIGPSPLDVTHLGGRRMRRIE